MLREDVGVGMTRDDVAENAQPGDAGDIADHDGELEVHLDQGLLHVVVDQHRPEAPERLGWDRDAELRHVPLEEPPDELPPPVDALRFGGSQERPRESPAPPESEQACDTDLVEREAGQVVVGDASGQRLGGLAQQVGRCAAEHQEARAHPGPVGQHPEHGKDLGRAMDLVEDDDAPQGRQREVGIGQAGTVGAPLQVEERRRPLDAGDQGVSQRRLADLARA
jgi:hypothetical protein